MTTLMRIRILPVGALAFLSVVTGSRPISAQTESCRSVMDAVEAGEARLTLEANDSEFYNEPLDYSVENLTADQLDVCFPAGLTMISGSGDYQNLVLTKTVALLIPPSGTQAGSLYADCINLSRHAPASGGGFTPGDMAQGDLLRVVQAIDRQSAQGRLGAQMAVWAVTDNLTLEDFGNGSESESTQMLQLVAPLLCLATDEIELGQSLLEESNASARLYSGQTQSVADFCASRGLPVNIDQFMEQVGKWGSYGLIALCGGFCLCGLLVVGLIVGIILLIRSRRNS
jgi:hypothetical protein